MARRNGDHAHFLSFSNVSSKQASTQEIMPCVIVTVGPIDQSIYTALLVQSYTGLLVQSWLK